MPKGTRSSWLPALVLALSLLVTPAAVPAQPSAQAQTLIDAVTGNPGDAPRLTAQEIVAGRPESAVLIVTDVVRALPYDQRLAVAPRVVSSAIGALPPSQRAPQAPAIACAAIRAAPAEQQAALVVPIVTAAAAMAPSAGSGIASCAVEAVPGSAAAIVAVLRLPPAPPQFSATQPSPVSGSSIGRDIVFPTQFQQAPTCASPPCP